MTRSFKTLPSRLKIAVICLCCVFFFSILEIGAYFFTTNEWVLETTTQLSSTRWYLVWLNRQRNDEAKQVITGYDVDSYHPFLGWSPKKNSHVTMYDKTIVNFNSMGIRGVKEYSFEKPKNWKRIAIVGDSFTFGESVNDSETYSAQLEKKLTKTEVMNFAVHGYGLDQMLLRFEQKVIPYKPDILVFAFIYDDIDRSFLSFRDYQKPRFVLTETNQLELTNTPIQPVDELIRRSKFQPKTALAFQLLYERWKLKDYGTVPTERFFTAALTRVYQQAIEHHITPVFLTLPTGSEMLDFTSTETGAERLLFNFCKNTTAVCLSARPYLMTAYNTGVRYDSNRHYDTDVHQIIADGLLDDLIKHKIITND